MRTVRIIRKGQKSAVVRVLFKNPALRGRTGRLRSRTMILMVNDHGVEIHALIGAAHALGRSPVRVLQLIREGKLQAYRIGKEWLVLGPDLAAYMNEEKERLRKRYRRYLEW